MDPPCAVRLGHMAGIPNGNPQKQNRGLAFRSAFEEVLAKITGEGGAAGLNEDGTQKRFNKFINIPR